MTKKYISKRQLALRIKQFRKEQNYKQETIAQELQIRQPTYSDIENGKIDIKAR